ncbi:MAG: POTRA domain-containing protein, partial [Candidatus Aminicenantales bacterium]
MSKFIKDSEFSNKGARVLNLGLFLGLFVIWCGFSYSQVSAAAPFIKKISVEVKGQTETKNMEELIPIKEGERLSLQRITDSIKELYKTGLFSDVQVIKVGQNQVNLTYRLTKKLFVRKILFLGQVKVPTKKLREAIYSLREQSSFSEGKLKLAAAELKKALSKEGFFSPQIKILTKKDFETSKVDVFFEISSSQRYIVKRVNLVGRLILPASQLKAKMKTRENQLYIPSLLERDVALLKKLYSSLDYHRAEVEVASVDFKDKGEVYITLKINPHEKMEIIVRGAKVPLNLIQPIWEEKIFEEWGLAEGEAKIINYLRGKGYLFSSVKSSLEKGKDKIRVIYQVIPGEKFGIEDLVFKGLKYFTPSQLKKELGIREKIPFLKWISGSRIFSLPQEIENLYQRQGFPHTTVDLNFIREDRK